MIAYEYWIYILYIWSVEQLWFVILVWGDPFTIY